ncbi:TPA: hypothetical protein N0F65_009601 [Lagenidium giganteum]|uniref:Expansin-like EG45 domain-containing protein n=1 Tax=Lagenidium giganteum TaxID=4803 RepID=A0AAV2YRS9_9STRA|nr:TPA: hypothetical protein N0F65_009601 [Lagenidium giganteum]
MRRSRCAVACSLLVLSVAVFLGTVDAKSGSDQGPGSNEYFEGKATTYILDEPSRGLCGLLDFPDNATVNYVSMNKAKWNESRNCGRCVEIICEDKKCNWLKFPPLPLYVTDYCPKCKGDDLYVSPSAFNLTAENETLTLSVKWHFVKCPVVGNAHYCLHKTSNEYWTAVQPTNMALGIDQVKICGRPADPVNSTYFYVADGSNNISCDLSAASIELRSIGGEWIKDKVALTPGECTVGNTNFGIKKVVTHNKTALIAGSVVGVVLLLVLGFVIKERIDKRRGRDNPIPPQPRGETPFQEHVSPVHKRGTGML